MSFFRPHKSKPRQFNYTPRYYDPVKEERERRRRELHGTSSADDNEEYVPGKYIRTQREARDASFDEGRAASSERLRGVVLMAIVLIVAILYFYPRFMRFVERANEEKVMQQQREAVMDADTTAVPRVVLYEQHGDIDFREFESLTPESINEIEEWNRQNPTINIYDDDVEIVDGTRVK